MPKEQEELSKEQLEGILAESQIAQDDDIEAQLEALMNGDEPLDENEEPRVETSEQEATEQHASEDEPVEEPDEADEEEEEPTEETDEALAPPADWSADEHELFHNLDTAAQKFVLDKTGSLSTSFAEERKAFDADKARLSKLDEVLAPRTEAFRMEGLDAPAALQRLFSINDFATSQPEDFIKWFAHNRQVDLAKLTGAEQQTDQNSDFQDPETAALKQQVTELTNQVQQLGGTLKTREQDEKDRITAEEEQAVNRFKNETGADGKPLRPFFEEVKLYMASLMRPPTSIGDLQTAYEMAVRAHPDVSRKIEVSRKAAASREASQAQRKKARTAKRAGSSVAGTPQPQADRKTFDDPEAELRAVAEELGAQL